VSQRYTISEHGPRIDGFLKKLLPLLGVDVAYEMAEHETVHPEFENPDIRVKFSGRDVDQLLANKTEMMLALEHLTLEILRVPAEEHSRICFDANDHRMLRIEELRASAGQAADRVRSTQAPFRFNPMNSRERRILHLALRGETALRSESEGLEPRRYVVIYPAGMPSQPPPPEFERSLMMRSNSGGSAGGGDRRSGPGGGPGGFRDRDRGGDRGGGGPRRSGPGGGGRDRGPRPPRP
jgi:spoIIIJ-associated protein